MKTAIQFPNENGHILRGIFYSPINGLEQKRDRIIIFPNGGVMGAEGDYRAYVSMAKQLVDNGYYVMRFSPAGLGISDGDIGDCYQKNLFNQIENGRFVDDIKSAVKYALSLKNIKSATLAGICGGAISAFLAAADINEVDSVIPIGIPVILDDPEMDYNQRIVFLDKQFLIKSYLDKLVDLKSWWKMISGKSNIKNIVNVISIIFKKKQSYLSNDDDKTKFMPNPLFFEMAQRIFNKKKVLFVFGDSDGFWWEFQTLFLNKYYSNIKHKPFDIYISKSANHMLSLPEMQFDVTQRIMKWLNYLEVQSV